mgnify:CR=1 FL=1
MKIVVLKFGGTSVGTIDRIKKVADLISGYVKKKYKVIVVSSAMSGKTNDLVKKFSQDSNDYNPIHISPKYASRSLYGEVICHGSLILYLILKKILTKKTNFKNEFYSKNSSQKMIKEIKKFLKIRNYKKEFYDK